MQVSIGGLSDIMAFSAIRSRNIRHLVSLAFTHQFIVNFSRLTPTSTRCLTGGIGMLTRADLDRFDAEVQFTPTV